MALTGDKLLAEGGEIFCYVFENRKTGVPRDLFWSLRVDFKQLQFDDVKCKCLTISDWIRWPIRDWRDLNGRSADFGYGENGFESSFYLFTHHPAERTHISLTRRTGSEFIVRLSMLVSIQSNIGFEVENPLRIETSGTARFGGLILIPENVGLNRVNNSQLLEIASQFVELNTFNDPECYDHGLKLSPRID